MSPDNNQQDSQDKPVEYGPSAVVTGGSGRSSISSVITKKPVLIVVVALLLLGAGALYQVFGKVADIQETTQQQINLLGVSSSVVDGTASYKTSDGDWQALSAGVTLAQGSTVKTEAESRAVLNFDDGSALRLDENSEVQMASLVADDIRVVQYSGSAYSRVVPSERVYTVEIDDTGYTALGTAFSTVNTEDEAGVQVIESEVKVDGVEESVAEGEQYFKRHKKNTHKDKKTKVNLDDIKSDEFMLWNLELDEKDDKFKDKLGYWKKVKEQRKKNEKKQGERPESTNGIRLSAANNSKGTVLSWTVSGVDVSQGFKVVRSKENSKPTYGRDDATYVGSSDSRSYTWGGSEHVKEYWYRVCAYRGDSCVSYSNAVKIKSVYKAKPKVTRGTMTLELSGTTLSWSYTGKAVHGYKVVVSTDANPTYPEDGYVYYGGSTTHELNVSKLEAGDNFIRVCAYTAGTQSEKCVDYSNPETYTKP